MRKKLNKKDLYSLRELWEANNQEPFDAQFTSGAVAHFVAMTPLGYMLGWWLTDGGTVEDNVGQSVTQNADGAYWIFAPPQPKVSKAVAYAFTWGPDHLVAVTTQRPQTPTTLAGQTVHGLTRVEIKVVEGVFDVGGVPIMSSDKDEVYRGADASTESIARWHIDGLQMINRESRMVRVCEVHIALCEEVRVLRRVATEARFVNAYNKDPKLKEALDALDRTPVAKL